jgi:hypothetical protein
VLQRTAGFPVLPYGQQHWQEDQMTQDAVSFILGIVAPVALVSWLIILH